MRPRRRGLWLGGLLMLSQVGCTILSPRKPPPPKPQAEAAAEAPQPPEAATPPPAPAEATPPPAEAKKEAPPAEAAPAPPPTPPPAAPAEAAPPPAPPPAPTAQRGKFVVLNFDNADIEVVVHAASEIVGFNYVLAPDVKGKITVQT